MELGRRGRRRGRRRRSRASRLDSAGGEGEEDTAEVSTVVDLLGVALDDGNVLDSHGGHGGAREENREREKEREHVGNG